MKKRFLASAVLVVAIFSGTYFGYLQLKKRDFDLICEVHTQMLGQQGAADFAMQAYLAAKKINDGLLTSAARQADSHAALADPKDKYHIYVEAAKAAGYSEFRCPAMERADLGTK